MSGVLDTLLGGPLRENKQGTSMVKASTPEPVGKGGPLWKTPGLHLPPYIQHVANDLIPKHGESKAVEMAVGIVKNWRDGHDGHGHKVTADTQAAAAKAITQWEADKAKAHARSAAKRAGGSGKAQESLSVADELAIVEGCETRLRTIEEMLGARGMASLLEADASSWSPTLHKTASASSETERFEVHDDGQHVGYLAKRKGYSDGPGRQQIDRWHAHAINGERLGDYGGTSKPDAITRLRSHLEEAPARVAQLGSKWLVAQPSRYSDESALSYRVAPSEAVARHMAGLPPEPTTPEKQSKAADLAEAVVVDLRIVEAMAPRRRDGKWTSYLRRVSGPGAQPCPVCGAPRLPDASCPSCQAGSGLAQDPDGAGVMQQALLQERSVPQAKREALLKKGHAIKNPDGSIAYPIETLKDLENAATLARSGHGDVAKAKRLIAKRAKDFGVKNPLDASDGKAQESDGFGIGVLAEVARPVPFRLSVPAASAAADSGGPLGALLEAFTAPSGVVPAQAPAASGGGGGGGFSAGAHPRGYHGYFIASGASGTAVTRAQNQLGVTASGQYDAATKQAIEQFQRQHGLQVDGVIGTQTMAAMLGNAKAAGVAPGAMTTAQLKQFEQMTSRNASTRAQAGKRASSPKAKASSARARSRSTSAGATSAPNVSGLIVG